MRKYLIHTVGDNPNPFIIKDKLYEAFLQTQFIEEIVDFSQPILIKEAGKSASLNKVEIDISDAKEIGIERIWRVNLEKEIIGISTKNYFRTPEVALLFLQKKKENEYQLHVMLVEMKSSLNDTEIKKNSDKTTTQKKGELETIPEKLQAGMNRMYLYLAIKKVKNFEKGNIYVDFQGLIFYGKNNIKKEYDTDLYKIFAKISAHNILTFQSILESQDKIKIFFFNHNRIVLRQIIPNS